MASDKLTGTQRPVGLTPEFPMGDGGAKIRREMAIEGSLPGTDAGALADDRGFTALGRISGATKSDKL